MPRSTMTLRPGLLLLAALCSAIEPDLQSAFEAAFQGRCGHGSPCEQRCYELHDGMFECDCEDGFVLHRNGYSCLRMNATTEPLADEDEDILYQKDASFSAELEAPGDDGDRLQQVDRKVQFVTTLSPNLEQKVPGAGGGPAGEPRTTESLGAPCPLDCGPAGQCAAEPGAGPRCQCPLGRGGDRCERDVVVRSPRFTGRGWLAFPALRAAYKHVQLELEFRPEAWDGVLLLAGERDDMAGDFMALLLHQGFLEFRFECGSGPGVVRSEETVLLNQWNRATLYRHRWDAWVQLNSGRHVEGRSKGLFSRITFREPLFVGGPGNTTGLAERLPVEDGLRGCIRRLEVNDHVYSFAAAPQGDSVKGFDVEECVADKCSKVPCQHGGKCLTSGDATAVCLCPLGFAGDLCETRVDLQVPSFNGSSYLRYPGLGGSALSWLDLQLTLKPSAADGVVLYNGHRTDGMGDFMAVYMSDGHLEFTFDLGTGAATIRSGAALSLGEWHELRLSRTGRLAVLRVDDGPSAQAAAPGAFTQLSLPQNLYIGGVPDFDMVSPKVRVRTSFVGCIQKVVINDRPLQIVSAALGGANVDNCPHPCAARPCGERGRCVPQMDYFTCDCGASQQEQQQEDPQCSRHAAPVILDDVAVPRFGGDSFLHFSDPDTMKRIVNYKLSINMRFRTTSESGLLLWSGRRNMTSSSDCVALGLSAGRLHFRFNLGGGEARVDYNYTVVSDGLWHRLKATRNEQEGSLSVDNGPAMTSRAPGFLKQLNTNTGLYIGGMDNIQHGTMNKYVIGMVGCISDLILDTDYHVHLVHMSTAGRNIKHCG